MKKEKILLIIMSIITFIAVFTILYKGYKSKEKEKETQVIEQV